MPNFVLLDATLPDVARLVAAMVQAREAVDRRSWAHPQEPTGEECGPMSWPILVRVGESGAPVTSRCSVLSIRSPTSRVKPSSSHAASASGGLRFCATTSSPCMAQTTRCPTYSTISPHRIATGSARIGIAAVFTTSSRLKRARAASSRWRRVGDLDPKNRGGEVTTTGV